MDFDQTSFGVQHSALENEDLSPQNPRAPGTSQPTPLAQLDSNILEDLIEEKQDLDKLPSPQQNNQTLLDNSDFVNGSTAFESNNIQEPNLGLSTTMEPKNMLSNENLCSKPSQSQLYVRENFEEKNHEIIGNPEPKLVTNNDFGNTNWDQNFANQSNVPKNDLLSSTDQPNCDNLTQLPGHNQVPYQSIEPEETELTSPTNYHAVAASNCMQQQGFQQENCSNSSETQADFSTVSNQHFSVPFNDQTNLQDQATAYKSPCNTEIVQSQANNPLPVQHIDSSQTMVSSDEPYPQANFSAPNLHSTLAYNPNPSDVCLAPGNKLGPSGNTQQYQGHGYHGDFGSSSGYETQSNTSASPYTSPDSIASLQQGGSDVTTCTSASNSHMDMQFSSQVQTSLCSGGQRVQGYSQPPQSSSSLMYSAPSTDSGIFCYMLIVS